MKQHPLNNHVILHDGTNGAEIIAFWKKQEVNTRDLLGNMDGWYYGLIDNNFDCYPKSSNCTIITLPCPPKFTPKRGDWVMVGNGDPITYKRIFLVEIEGAKYPYISVREGYEADFNNGHPFDISIWTHIAPCNPTELTIEEAEQKLSEVLKQEVRIKP